jgi:hypothetical protein
MRHRKSIVTKSTVLMLAAFLALGTFASRSAEAASPAVGIPVTGTLDDGGTFAGTLDVQRFRARDGAPRPSARSPARSPMPTATCSAASTPCR